MQDNMPAPHLSPYAHAQGSHVSCVTIEVRESKVATVNAAKAKEQAFSRYIKKCVCFMNKTLSMLTYLYYLFLSQLTKKVTWHLT